MNFALLLSDNYIDEIYGRNFIFDNIEIRCVNPGMRLDVWRDERKIGSAKFENMEAYLALLNILREVMK